MPEILACGPWGESFVVLPNDVAHGLLYTQMLGAEQAVPPRPCTLNCRIYRSHGNVYFHEKGGGNGLISPPVSALGRLRFALCLFRCKINRDLRFPVIFKYGDGGGDGHEPGSQWRYNEEG